MQTFKHRERSRLTTCSIIALSNAILKSMILINLSHNNEFLFILLLLTPRPTQVLCFKGFSYASQNFIVVTFLGVELRIKGKAEFSWSESQSYTDFRGERLHKSVIHRGKDTYLKTNIKLVEGKFIIQCFIPLRLQAYRLSETLIF